MEKISHDYFWDVVRMPIQFPKAIQKLESGADNIYIDLGPGGTLANFAKRNMTDQSNSRCYTIITPFHQELKNLLKNYRNYSGDLRFIDIEVDGGINQETADSAVRSGANVLVLGTAIYKCEDPSEAVKKVRESFKMVL